MNQLQKKLYNILLSHFDMDNYVKDVDKAKNKFLEEVNKHMRHSNFKFKDNFDSFCIR